MNTHSEEQPADIHCKSCKTLSSLYNTYTNLVKIKIYTKQNMEEGKIMGSCLSTEKPQLKGEMECWVAQSILGK